MNNEQQMQKIRLEETMAKIKHKIVVTSGKGGVGKSTMSANIAYGLALEGRKVGILDADLHGPNIPIMFGVEGQKMEHLGEPYKVHENLKMVSLSMILTDSDAPVVWRGPAKTGAILQLLADVNWGELDYLVVDLPPGTGDEPLTVAQNLGNVDGAVIVTTPQDVALLDSRKSVKFSKLVNMPVMGIIENMSGFICPHCGERIDIFKTGGGEKAAKELGVEFLGKIPLNPEIVTAGDDGKPHIYFNNNEESAKSMREIINRILEKTESKEEEKEIKGNGKEDEKKSIKIAFPTNDDITVEEHFGHCKKFLVVEIENGIEKGRSFIDAPPHQPGLLPKFLGERGINIIITGGMGQRAVDLFKERNVEVILGARGEINENLEEYLGGDLYSTGSVCNHDHEEGHSCGH